MEGAWGGVWLPIRSADWRSWAGSGGALAVAGVSEITMPPSGNGLIKHAQMIAAPRRHIWHLGARFIISVAQFKRPWGETGAKRQAEFGAKRQFGA